MEKYCAFIDVLGYGNLVKDPTKTQEEKIKILTSIYENLATQLQITVNEINSVITDKIFIKSFSDCFYMESTNLLALLYTTKQVFSGTLNFYVNTDEYTPLIRGGIVKDWTVRFKDLAAVVNNHNETNPVGLGVARAYWTSEKTHLSGMRIIISPEVIKELKLDKHSHNNCDCYVQTYYYRDIIRYLFLTHIRTNENNCPTDLCELIWTEEALSDCTFDYVEQLKKMRANFDNDSLRHYKKTAEVILKGLLLSDCDKRTGDTFEQYKRELIEMIS